MTFLLIFQVPWSAKIALNLIIPNVLLIFRAPWSAQIAINPIIRFVLLIFRAPWRAKIAINLIIPYVFFVSLTKTYKFQTFFNDLGPIGGPTFQTNL